MAMAYPVAQSFWRMNSEYIGQQSIPAASGGSRQPNLSGRVEERLAHASAMRRLPCHDFLPPAHVPARLERFALLDQSQRARQGCFLQYGPPPQPSIVQRRNANRTGRNRTGRRADVARTRIVASSEQWNGRRTGT